MEAWPVKALKAAPISRKLRNCSEYKNLIETKKVAGNTKSCQKVDEQLMASSQNALFTLLFTAKGTQVFVLNLSVFIKAAVIG